MKLFVLIAISCLCMSVGLAQQAPPPPPAPPPPIAKATPADVSEKTDQQLEAEIVESVKKPVEWKKRLVPGFGISVDTPRESIRQTETYTEPGLGRMQLVMHLSVGDESIFMIGRITLPYSVTDEKVLRSLYTDLASGMSEEGDAPFHPIKDLNFEGHIGVEMRTRPQDIRYQPARCRAFVLGRDVYILIAMPSENENDHEPPEKGIVDSRAADFDRFFDSLAVLAKPSMPNVIESPLFSSSWKDGKYISDRFKFAFEPPKSWVRISQEDVEGVRNWSRQAISDEAGKSLPRPGPRRNLITFTSAPLGTEGVAMISFNLGMPSSSFDDVRKLAAETERQLGGLSNYKILKRPFETTLGSDKAMAMHNTITIAGMSQEQHIYYFLRERYVLGLVLTCVEKADCSAAFESLSSLKFEGR